MHYYQFNIGDYRRDTAHLSMLEHGAYRQLIDQYYLKEKPIPEDIEMRTLCARTTDEVDAVKYILTNYFHLTAKGYIHNSCDQVIKKYNSKSEKARQSANARWNKELLDKKEGNNAMRMHTEGNANHKPITNNHKPKDQEKRVKRFTPPSLSEVQEYCNSKNIKFDSENFINFYESKGWMIGKNKMKSWKACIATWIKRDNQKGDNNEKRGSSTRVTDNLKRLFHEQP